MYMLFYNTCSSVRTGLVHNYQKKKITDNLQIFNICHPNCNPNIVLLEYEYIVMFNTNN